MGKGHKLATPATVERKNRFVQTDALKSMDARTMRKAVEGRFKKLEPALKRAITFDQVKENSEHKELSENTGTAVYFCHPHSPREKGACENTNCLMQDMPRPVDDFRKLG
jgi:IS30 family transposase